MAEVLKNTRLSDDFFLLKVKEPNNAKMGQFHMLRAWGTYPLLSRAISVYDTDGESLTFLYKCIGEGTELLSKLHPQDKIEVGRSLGNTFPEVKGKIALVGGGVGIAPLHLAAKTLCQTPGTTIDIFLGFRSKPLLEDDFRPLCSQLVYTSGGFITDKIAPERYDAVFSCGPEPMMRVLYQLCQSTKTPLYVSLESKMACGIGICLGCSCETSEGRKKICTDGPVFLAEEVFKE